VFLVDDQNASPDQQRKAPRTLASAAFGLVEMARQRRRITSSCAP
jgi:hypothetical protein